MKKSLTIILLLAIIIAIVSYIYYPITQTGCEKLKAKIESQISSATECNLAQDCVISYEMGCDFKCDGYFSQKAPKNLISRYNRRCKTCQEECYFKNTNPACLAHTCKATGGAVQIKTNQEEYQVGDTINLELKNNLLTEIIYPFPISLCLRPTIIRLEQYNEETKEWLSSGVGLLFDNNQIKIYKDPGECPSYKIKNCTKEEASRFIDEDTLKVSQAVSYAINPESIMPCENNQEIPSPLQGRYRIGLYYEPGEGSGDQIYSNEFVVNMPDENMDI